MALDEGGGKEAQPSKEKRKKKKIPNGDERFTKAERVSINFSRVQSFKVTHACTFEL